MKYKVTVSIVGQMVEDMLENGIKIKCKEMEKLYGLMEEYIKVLMIKIWNKGLVFFVGKMVKNILEIGCKEDNME